MQYDGQANECCIKSKREVKWKGEISQLRFRDLEPWTLKEARNLEQEKRHHGQMIFLMLHTSTIAERKRGGIVSRGKSERNAL